MLMNVSYASRSVLHLVRARQHDLVVHVVAPATRAGHSGARACVYPGYPHGMCTTPADTINADLLDFIQA